MVDETIDNEIVSEADAPAVDAPVADAPVADAPVADASAAAEPVDYGQFALPEGMEIDPSVLGQAVPLFQELNLPQDQAQKVVSLYAQVKQADRDNTHRAWQQAIEGWRTELKADPAFGGANLVQTTSSAAKAIDAYGGKDAPAIREFMTAYGLGDHPAFARFLARVGRSVTEDRLPRAQGAPAQKVTARDLYPNSNMS